MSPSLPDPDAIDPGRDEPTPSHDPIDEAIASYLAAVEAGAVPDRESWIARHPDLADRLRAFFADLDRMDRVAAPLRLDPGGDATADLGDGPPSPSPACVRYFGDYELIEEIARGGMGVVYKARQTSLNRVVALKMILRGAFATPGDLARFRAEAEAVAQLDHPHIVPIFEVGEHDGLQYFTMKFIDGPPLGRLPRRSPRDEVLLLRDLASAVHYAHQRGILHRDLKPSNVLLDSRGTPYVTDFGLAKRLTDPNHSLTEPGQLLGTPRYMAPEQAEGRRDLTVSVDVYALGALLYERLSGRPAFPGDDLLDLLDRVRHSPPPVLTPSDGADRDLATIASTCLQKAPADRYPDASSLLADLSRWLHHEPILARPVSAPERLRRWCLRNPALAGLTGAVAASLLLGTAVSTMFALRANERAEAERAARARSERAEDRAKGLLARGFIKPLDGHSDIARDGKLAKRELEALWELATIDLESIGLRTLDEAIRDPILTTQLASRAEPALVAAIGLSSTKHPQASRLILERLNDRSLPIARRSEIALIGLGLVDRPGPLGDACVATIAEARDSERLHPGESESRIAQAILGDMSNSIDAAVGTEAVLTCMEGLESPAQLLDLTHRLGTLTEHLAPERSAEANERAVGFLLDAFESDWLTAPRAPEFGTSDVDRLYQAMALVLGKMEPAEALRCWSSMIPALAAVGYGWSNLGEAVMDAVRRWESTGPGPARGPVVRAIVEALAKPDGARSTVLAHPETSADLIGLLIPMDRAETAGWCNEAADALVERLAQPIDADACRSYGQALAMIASGLEPDRAADACSEAARSIVDHIRMRSGQIEVSGQLEVDAGALLVLPLATLASKMPQDEAARLTAEVATLMANGINLESDPGVLYSRARSLVRLAAFLRPGEATRLCVDAASTLAEAAQSDRREAWGDQWLADALSALAVRLPTPDAAVACEAIASLVLRKSENWYVRHEMVDLLAAAVGGMEAEVRSVLLARVMEGLWLEYECEKASIGDVAECVTSLAPGMESAEVALMADRLVRRLVKELEPQSDLPYAVRSLGKLMDPDDVVEVCHLIEAKQPALWRSTVLMETMVEAFERIDDNQAEQIGGETAKKLANALTRSDNLERRDVARMLALVACRLGPDTVTEPINSAMRSLLPNPTDADREASPDHGSLLWNLVRADRENAIAFLLPVTEPIAAHHIASEMARLSTSELSLNVRDPDHPNDRYRLATLTWLMADLRCRDAIVRGLLTEETQDPSCVSSLPCRLSILQLVQLLKMPTCYGEARRVVLDYIGHRYGRRFDNHWQFVRFAEEEGLGLDFESPPVRPDPGETFRRIREILGE